MDLYYPTEVAQSIFEAKGSQFLSFLIPIECFEEFLNEARVKHTKAVHFVTASRYFNAQSQIVESFSDDGEPKGTSGMPTLKVLRGYDLIECALLSVRYFGGTLLGTGGLVRAYTQGAKGAILQAQEQNILKAYIPQSKETLFVSFSLLAQVEYLAKKMEVKILKKEFLDKGVKLDIQAHKDYLSAFVLKVKSLNF
ncbi:YigZ family protein [Helicobacter sp. 11-8110]|uniref:YigZ family protein n=1 Tax=Helicobacter sp. 11-8110 TaxID=2004997 RepID=UPI000DCB8BB9|nr:YigZ family protein [Helicobacter sp. 11-8110]RAX53473.1 hypothetical protein CCY98_01270 [Helicobacter sp. 11-8110]